MKLFIASFFALIFFNVGFAKEIAQKAAPSAYLDVSAENIRVLPHTIDVTFTLVNKSSEDLDLSKSFWKATYGKAFGGINRSQLDGIMLASKQKRSGDMQFSFDSKIDRNSLLDLRITNIKTLKGKSVPDIVLKLQAQSSKKTTPGADARRQEDTIIQWSQVR